MAEENQVMTKGPKKVEAGKRSAEENQVTTKDPKKVETGKRLAEYSRRKREAQKSEELKSQKSEVLTSSTCYGILAVGVIGGLGYYLYQAKVNNIVPQQPSPQQLPKSNKFEME